VKVIDFKAEPYSVSSSHVIRSFMFGKIICTY